MFKKDYFAHKTAIIEPGAEIGDGTKIWHKSVIREGAVIGKNCIICQDVFIDSDVVIGDGCKVKNGSLLFAGVTLEDDVFIAPNVSFTNVVNPRAFIEKKHEFKKTIVRKGATIGAGSVILCGVEIGEYTLLGAGSVLTHNTGKYTLFYGNPARFRGYVNKNGDKCKFSEVML